MNEKDTKINIRMTSLTIKMFITIQIILWLLFVAGLTVLRYLCNYSGTFDFGLFSQMYYYMDKTFLPVTTAERNMYMSHFAVHVSPIFYTILPVYKIFASQITLLVCQAIIVISGIIPLYKICRKYNMTDKEIWIFSLMYCLFPAFIGGCFYDFHENKFLTVIILWMIYFLEMRKYKASMLFAILLCMVKEDAPVYAACLGLFFIFYKKEYKYGMTVFIMSVVYFMTVTTLMKKYGIGIMTNRFSNLMYDDSLGLAGVIKTVMVNPVYAVKEMITEDKIVFLLQVMMPLGFLPLINNKWSKWILVIPFVLVNMLSDYKYQHSIYFQYTYGSCAMLFYLAVINYCEYKERRRDIMHGVIILAIIASVLITDSTMSSKLRYLDMYISDYDILQEVDDVLAKIPEEASVESHSGYVPKLSLRRQIYKFDNRYKEDYIVVDLRKSWEKNGDEVIEQAQKKGYVLTDYIDGYVAVLKKSTI